MIPCVVLQLLLPSNMADLHAPTARLAVETALLANGTNLINFIGFIIKKFKEVKSYRDECSKLVNMSIKLSLVYLEHQKDLQKIRLGNDFLHSLQQVYLLVIECSQSWSILHIGWEVFCAGKVAQIMEELRKCQEGFNTEILVTIPHYDPTYADDNYRSTLIQRPRARQLALLQ